MISDLIFIYTLFDDKTNGFMNKLLPGHDKSNPVLVCKNIVIDVADFNKISMPDGVALLLLCDKSELNDDAKSMVTRIIENANNVLLVLHKGSSNNAENRDRKYERRKFIMELAGDKFNKPVLEEHHTSGKIFDLLCAFGNHFSNQDFDACNETLHQFLFQFEIDYFLEAKLELMNTSRTKRGIATLRNGTLPRPKTADFLNDFLAEEFVKNQLQKMAESDDALLPDLQKELNEFIVKIQKAGASRGGRSGVSK